MGSEEEAAFVRGMRSVYQEMLRTALCGLGQSGAEGVGADAERDRIVAWLEEQARARGWGLNAGTAEVWTLVLAAEDIRRGEHRK